MRKLWQHQRVQLRMPVTGSSGFVLANPDVNRVSGFKGLFYKPLNKKVVPANSDIAMERDTR